MTGKWTGIIFVDKNGHPESFGLEFNMSESELFWVILKSVSESFGIIPNQSEKRFVSLFM